MQESVAVAKEADRKQEFSPTNTVIHHVRDEHEMQLGSLGGGIGDIRRDGGAPSVESIATELGSRSAAERTPALLALQQTHGNRYVQRVVSGIQAKLKIGQPDNKYEQEADRVAEQVMRMPDPGVQRYLIQHWRGQEEDQEKLPTMQISPPARVALVRRINRSHQPILQRAIRMPSWMRRLASFCNIGNVIQDWIRPLVQERMAQEFPDYFYWGEMLWHRPTFQDPTLDLNIYFAVGESSVRQRIRVGAVVTDSFGGNSYYRQEAGVLGYMDYYPPGARDPESRGEWSGTLLLTRDGCTIDTVRLVAPPPEEMRVSQQEAESTPEPQVQRRANEKLQVDVLSRQGSGFTRDLETRLRTARGGGNPLCAASRTLFEPRFGVDFSNVRIHTDAEADTLGRVLNAHAFTAGQDIFFRQGEYNPESLSGQELIAHELTHVVQQQSVQGLLRSVTKQKETKNPSLSHGGIFAPQKQSKSVSHMSVNQETVVQLLRTAYYVVRDRGLQSDGGEEVDDLAAMRDHLISNVSITGDWDLIISIHGAENILAAPARPGRPRIEYDAAAIRLVFNTLAFNNWRNAHGPARVILNACQVNMALEGAIINAITRHGTARQPARGLGRECRPYTELKQVTIDRADIETRAQYNSLQPTNRGVVTQTLTPLNRIWGYFGIPPVNPSRLLDYYFDEAPRGWWPIIRISVPVNRVPPQEREQGEFEDAGRLVTNIPFYNRGVGGVQGGRFTRYCEHTPPLSSRVPTVPTVRSPSVPTVRSPSVPTVRSPP